MWHGYDRDGRFDTDGGGQRRGEEAADAKAGEGGDRSGNDGQQRQQAVKQHHLGILHRAWKAVLTQTLSAAIVNGR
jgi:hypothetical protein